MTTGNARVERTELRSAAETENGQLAVAVEVFHDERGSEGYSRQDLAEVAVEKPDLAGYDRLVESA